MLCILLIFPVLVLAIKKWQDKEFTGLEMLYQVRKERTSRLIVQRLAESKK